MLYKNAVLSENGESHWGTKAVSKAEFEGSKAEVTLRYQILIAKLGIIGTEDARYRTISGEGADASFTAADHTFLFPPQNDLVMHSVEGDGSFEFEGNTKITTLEHKRAAITGLGVESELGVVLDTNAEPPRVAVYELLPARFTPKTYSENYQRIAKAVELTLANLTAE